MRESIGIETPKKTNTTLNIFVVLRRLTDGQDWVELLYCRDVITLTVRGQRLLNQ